MCSTVQYGKVQYSTVKCSTVQYSKVQYSTVQCSTVQSSPGEAKPVRLSTVLFVLCFATCHVSALLPGCLLQCVPNVQPL